MSDLTAVESALVARLAPLRDRGIRVHALPEEPKDYGVLMEATDKGLLTLILTRATPLGRSACPQIQAFQQEVMLYGHVMGTAGQGGVTAIVREIEQLLTGYVLEDVGPLRVGQGYQFLGRSDKYWEFQYGYQFTRLVRGTPQG